MRCLKWILTSLFVALAAKAEPALSTLPSATSFYRGPHSEFVSGQTSKSTLERTRTRTELTFLQKIRWNNREYVLKSDDFLRDLQCLTTGLLRENSGVLTEMRSDSPATVHLTRGAEVEILHTVQHWARIRHGRHEGWMPLHRLEGRNDDVGVFVALIDTFLRDKPSFDGRIHTTLPRRTRMKAVSFHDGWIKINHDGRTGYVDSLHLAGRADFALWAWKKSGTWVLVSHREGTALKTKTGETLPLADVSAYAPNTSKGIVTQIDEPKLPPLRAHAELVKTEITRWGVSSLAGHGEVWWRQESLVADDSNDGDKETLSTEELLKRDVFSYALRGTKTLEGLVSARGVWRTQDGHHWRRIPEFGERNLPVALHANGDWYVGSHRSKDKGITFEPFIKWDSLTRVVEARLKRQPRYLKLQKIESLPSAKVQLMIDTGVRRVTVTTSPDGNVFF